MTLISITDASILTDKALKEKEGAIQKATDQVFELYQNYLSEHLKKVANSGRKSFYFSLPKVLQPRTTEFREWFSKSGYSTSMYNCDICVSW